ncbi:hypothetical protein HAX54_039175 [Datura stramonium]|uniref:GDSL esterase/lipase n=1 Tax=Datura stramonium TaxID=4076 RepID=A0ABS8VNW3_DATST|nr:hypothetical protein [Datura stramonium]
MTITLASKVPEIIVFGNSSVDSGNNNQISTVLMSTFEPYGRDFYDKKPTGRFCNGRIPPDFISEAFGLRPFVPAYLDPAYSISDFAAGVCFAFAGTGYDNATSDVLGFKWSVGCCGTGLFEMGYLCNKLNPLTCTDANKFVFWDAFHVTHKTNHIISDFLMKHVFR